MKFIPIFSKTNQTKEELSLFMKPLHPCIIKLAICLCCIISTQTRAYEFKTLNVRNGLSHNRTYSIVKDRQGLMWFATRGGIDRYDGTSFRHHPLVVDKAYKGQVSRANDVIIDPEGTLWAYDNTGNIFRYVAKKGAFIHEVTLSTVLKGSNVTLRGVTFSRSGEMLVFGSFGLASYVYNSTKLVTKIVASQKNAPTDIGVVRHLKGNRYAIGTLNGVYLMEINAHKFNVKELTFETRGNRRVQAMTLDAAKQHLYFGTFGGSVFDFDINNDIVTKVETINSPFGIRAIEVRGDLLYIATGGYGLLKWNRKSNKIEKHYRLTVDDQDKLPSNSIYDVFSDGNRLWVASYNRGIAVLDQDLPDFQFIHNPAHLNSLYGNSISAILSASGNEMWFGTDNGINIYAAGKWQEIFSTTLEKRYRILALCEDKIGDIWAAELTSGVIRIDKKTHQIKGRFNDITSRYGKVDARLIYNIYSDAEGMLWFGGAFGKIIGYHPQTKVYREYESSSINIIKEFQGKLIIGTTKGLFWLDKQKGKVLPWPNSKGNTNPIFKNYINHIYGLGETLWFSTERGLVNYHPKNGSIKLYTQADGLASNVVYAIKSDELGRIWASTDRGLSVINPKTGKVYSFDATNGLKEDNFSPRAAALSADKKIWFGTVNGVLYFEPEKIIDKAIAAKLHFDDLLINYKSVYDSTSTYHLNEGLNELQKIVLRYNENSFSFNFSAINYTYKSRIYYRWKLSGYDRDFIDSRTGVKPSYANVSAGNYEFTVEAVETVSGKLLDSRTILIKVKAALWATWYAQLIYAAIFIFLAYYIYKTIRQRREQQDYENKIRYFADTAHEIKTPITLILGSLQNLSQDKQTENTSQPFLDMAIKHTKKLNLMVNRLLDFQRAEMRAMKLEAANHDIVDFVQSQVDKFYPLAIQKKIEITITHELVDRQLWFDASAMEVIVENLITNALKYTNEGGFIKIILHPYGNKELAVAVQDNGIGIAKEAQKQLFQRFYRGENAISSGESGTGIGLILARTLTELHGGRIELLSEINQRSTFTLVFKYGNEHLKDRQNITVMANYQTPPDLAQEIDPSLQIQTNEEAITDQPLVLIVEDNLDLRLFISRSLEQSYRIEVAQDAETGIEMLTNLNPDLIISDVMMPGMDGYEFCQKVKSDINTSHIPLILLTALDQKSNMVKGYDCGADNYVVKPFDITLLKMKIENTINSRRKLKEKLIQHIGGEQTISMQNNADDLFLKKITEKLEANISESEYSIDELCADMRISRSTFYNKIKGLTNHSPNDFIRIFRLNKAAQLLKSGDHNVNEVAYMTGFADTKYFSTIFKKHFGISPSKLL